MSDSVRPHRPQPTRLPRPWDSSGKNTGAGCHFLLQCMKVKSESEVAQSCPTLRDPMDCSLPVSSVHGIFQARVLEWGAIAFSASWVWEVPNLSSLALPAQSRGGGPTHGIHQCPFRRARKNQEASFTARGRVSEMINTLTRKQEIWGRRPGLGLQRPGTTALPVHCQTPQGMLSTSDPAGQPTLCYFPGQEPAGAPTGHGIKPKLRSLASMLFYRLPKLS